MRICPYTFFELQIMFYVYDLGVWVVNIVQ
jgi:hypothetical protein